MRTFSHHFREYRMSEARCLWDNPDVFGDGPEEQPQSSEHQEPADMTVGPEGIRVQVNSAEEMETSVQDEALHRMEQGVKEEENEKDLQAKLDREIQILLESIKGLRGDEQGVRVREFNEKFLHPLGHHLHLIDGKARISSYTPEDPRMAIYKAKMAELTAEISRATIAINQARIHGIAPMAREYRGFKRGMMRRGNIAPEISRFMMQFPAAGASALAPDLKKMYEHLAKKQMELAQLKQAGWQSMPMPAPDVAPATNAPLREESPPRFQRRVPMDRMEFSRGIDMLDPETRRQIRSLSPEFQQAIGSIASSLDEQGKNDLGSLTEKLASGNFNAKISAPIFNLDGTLRAPQDIRAEITQHPEEAKILEDIATFIESLSPNERKIMELIIKQAQNLRRGAEGNTQSSAEQIRTYKEQWEKAKQANDEASMEIAEGLLLMQGMEIDEKGDLTPLEEGFGGKGMGFIMGLVLVIDGFLKKIGEKMERKKKQEGKKDETPIVEMAKEKNDEEIKKSEKRIGELKKEQTDLKDQIKKGEEDLAKEHPETKHVLQMKLDDVRKALKKVEEELKKEEEKLKELKKLKDGVSKPVTQEKDAEKPKSKLEEFNTNKGAFKEKMRAKIKESISKLDPKDTLVKATRDQLEEFLKFNDASIDAMHLEKNKDGKYRITYDISSIVDLLNSMDPKGKNINPQEFMQKLKTSIEKTIGTDGHAYGLHEEEGKLVTNWVSAEMIEKLDSIIPQSAE